ncbi:MAG: epsE [Rhodocyclales bacterium]|nr:epsE [Rhodocyclales bacterium]
MLIKTLFLPMCLSFMAFAHAEAQTTTSTTPADYALTPGDIVHIQVYQNPDLTTDTRISDSGRVSFPLLGGVQIGGLTVSQAEALIAQQLSDGHFVVKPQVIVLLEEVRGNQIAVLGQVNKPGRFPLETSTMRLSDVLALAGGISEKGADTVVVTGLRNGKAFRAEIDITGLYNGGDAKTDATLVGGDAVFVNRAPVFYIYGEVQHPGSYRLDREMMLMQAIAAGGGATPRGTLRGIQVHRRTANGKMAVIEPKMDELLQPNDVVYVRESFF